MTTDSLVGDRAAAREVLRARRRATHPAGPWQVVQDWYVGLFITATMLTMLFAATGGAILTPDCDTAVCLPPGGYRLVALAMAVVGVAGLGRAAREAGPASTDPGRATWLLASPADRGVLLRGPIAQTGGVVLVMGASWGVLVGFALAGGSGGGAHVVGPVLACAAGGLACALVVLPVALWRQGGRLHPSAAARAVPDAELARAGVVVGAVSASTLMLDTVALDVLATQRRLARRGRYPSGAGRGGPLVGMLRHELRALRRRAPRLALAMLTCLGALVAGLLLGRFLGVVLAALAAFVATRAAAGGLATWVTTPGLRRAVPLGPVAVTTVLALPPFVVAVLASVVGLSALGLPWWSPLLLASGVLAGVLRSHDPPPDLGVAISTPGGAVQTGLVQRLVLGTDLALLSALVLLLADAHGLGAPAVLVGVGLLAWQVGRSRE